MIEKIKELILLKKDVNLPDEKGQYLLHQAAIEGNVEALELLINSGADVNQVDQMKNTALHFAAWNGKVDAVSFLIKNGAELNRKTLAGYTPLLCASVQSQKAVIDLLLKEDADVSVSNFENETALIMAVKNNDVNSCQLLIENGADIHHQNNEGLDSLMFAALLGHEDLVRMLIENGADLYKSDKLGNTALMHAAAQGYLQIVKDLTDKGVSLVAKNKSGLKAIDLAVDKQQKEVQEYLFEKMGSSAVHISYKSPPKRFFNAVISGDLEVVKKMLETGVQLDGCNSNGTTALMMASYKGHEHIVNYLLLMGADTYKEDENGATAMDYALKNERYEVAGLIKKARLNDETGKVIFDAIQQKDINRLQKAFSRGLSVDVRDENGDTPLIKAIQQWDLDIVKNLLDLGADATLKNNNGESVFTKFENVNQHPFKMVQMLALFASAGVNINQEINHKKKTLYDVICSKVKNKSELNLIQKLLKSFGAKGYRSTLNQKEVGRE